MEVGASPEADLAALGVATVVAEAVLVREGMSAFAGSELAWALVLVAWLGGVAVGSRAGSGRRPSRLGGWWPALVMLLAGGGVLLLRAIPALAGVTAGETAPAWRVFWIWPAAVLPAAVAGGFAFPAAAAGLDGRVTARAYAAEAAGAVAGGLAFTFLLAPLGSVIAVLWTAAGLSAFRLHRRRVVAAVLLAAAGLSAWPAASGVEALTWRWSGHPGRLREWRETRRQRLELSSGPPYGLYADGRLLASWPDPWSAGVRAHLMMLLHRRPKRVLAVGALADGTVTTLLEHPLERLDLVEEDPAAIRLLPRWYGAPLAAALADPRVHALAVDPVRAVREGGPWDLVLLLDPDPASLRRNRTRTLELFGAIAGRLAPGGRVVVATSVPDTYLGGAGGRLLSVLAATLRTVFPEVRGVPGERTLLVAGASLDDLARPEILQRRWNGLGLDDPVFRAELVPVLLDPARAAVLDRFLAAARGPVDTVRYPAAVLPAMALVEGRGLPRLAPALERLGREGVRVAEAAAVLLGVLLAAGGLVGRRAAGEAAAFAVGLGAMGAFVLLLAAWQSVHGSVFTEIGALTAGFMAGAAGGAALASGRAARGRWHVLAFLGLALVLMLAGSAVVVRVPAAIPALLVVAGGLAGLAFPGAAERTGEGSAAAGRGFAADEAGAALGALSCGLLLPVVGAGPLAVALACLLAAVVPGLIRYE